MKYLKMLGLAAVAAMAVAAFAGASTASATVCTEGTTTSPCGSGHTPYSGSIVAKLVPGTSAVLEGTLKVSCSESEVAGTTNSAGEGKLTSVTFKKCSNCPTVTSENLPWTAKATGSGGNGTMTVFNPRVLLQGCFFGAATCRATATEVNLEVIGGKPAKVIASNEPLKIETVSGFGCGSSGSWTATYETTTPSTGIWLE